MPKPIIAQNAKGDRIALVNGQWVPVAGGAGPAMKIAPQDRKFVADHLSQADTSDRMAGMAKRFQELNGDTATGPGYGEVNLPRWLGGGNINPLPGVMGYFNPHVAQMQAVAAQAAPQMRPSGSGSTSDTDMRLYQKAFPSLDKYGDANAEIAKDLQRQAAAQRAKANFYANFLNSHGTIAGADEAFRGQAQQQPQMQQRQAPAPMRGQPARPAAPPRQQAPRAAHQLSDAELRQALGIQ